MNKEKHNLDIAFHASHEQFTPSHLLELVKKAEDAGFTSIHSSDHFHPWSERQGQSGFTFSWIAAAMQVSRLPFSMVCAPGQRYHPAIVAQAIATLGEMFPGRYSVELGSGEALNESITGTPWPSKEIRNERLLESYRVICNLLDGKEVTYHGHINVREAKLYTRPAIKPRLVCAALTDETAEWAGGWADGLLTTSGTTEQVKKKISLFRDKAGNKPVYLQHSFSYHPSREKAIDGAYDQWRSIQGSQDQLAEFSTVKQFDENGEKVSREDVEKNTNIITDIDQLKEQVHSLWQTGVNRIVLHNLNREQERFIGDFGKKFF